MATAQQVAEYRLANQSLVALALRDLAAFWSALNLSSDPARIRDELLKFFPDLTQTYGDTAAVLGADWYDALRDVPVSARAFTPVVSGTVPSVQAEQSARWAIGPLFEGNPDFAHTQLAGSLQRLILQPGRDSFALSANRDPVRTAWGRVPSGATTCKWCVMLASRGAEYSTAASAGQMNEFHDNCDCVQVQVRTASDWPEGHNVEFFERLYVAQSGVGRDLPAL